MTHVMGWCALGDMVRVARVSRALKAIACAPDSWDILHLHETPDRIALRSLAKTFPSALRSAREICCISVLHRSDFHGLATFLEHACPTATIVGGDDGGDGNRQDSTVQAASVVVASASTVVAKKVDARLPNRRLRRLYLLDVDLRAPEIATLGALFPNVDELALFEHGSGVSQTYDAGDILTRMLSEWSHLRGLTVRFAGHPSHDDMPATTTTTITWRVPSTLVRLCVSAWRIADPQPVELATDVAGTDFGADDRVPLPAACRLRVELPRGKNAALETLRLEDAHICRLVPAAAFDDALPCLTQLYATAAAFADARTLARLLATETLGAVTLERMRLNADVADAVAASYSLSWPSSTQPAMRSLTLRGCETSLDFVRAVARRYTHLEDLRVVDCEKDGGGGAAGDCDEALRVVGSHGPRVASVIDIDQTLACLAASRAFTAGRLLHVQMPCSRTILLAPPPSSSSASFPTPRASRDESDAQRSTDRDAKGQTQVPSSSETGVDGDDGEARAEENGSDSVRVDMVTDGDRANVEVVDWRADAPACRVIMWNATDPSGTGAASGVASRTPFDAVTVRSLSSKPPTQVAARLIVTNLLFASRCEAAIYSPGLARLVAAGSDCAVTFGNARVIVFRGAVPRDVRSSTALPLRRWSAALVRAVSTAEGASQLCDRPLLLPSSAPPPLGPPKMPKIFAVGLARLSQVTHLLA